jgi:hypothetical protein
VLASEPSVFQFTLKVDQVRILFIVAVQDLDVLCLFFTSFDGFFHTKTHSSVYDQIELYQL